MRGGATGGQAFPDVCNRRASISLPINPLKTTKINNTRFGRIENALGKGYIWFGSLATGCDQDSHSCFFLVFVMLKIRPDIHNSIQTV